MKAFLLEALVLVMLIGGVAVAGIRRDADVREPAWSMARAKISFAVSLLNGEGTSYIDKKGAAKHLREAADILDPPAEAPEP